MQVTLAPFDSTPYREQQETDLRELQSKPCVQATLSATISLTLGDFQFGLQERFAKRILDLPSGITDLLVQSYGQEMMNRLIEWCHPGVKKTGSSQSTREMIASLQTEAISDTELETSNSTSPMDIELS